MTKEDKILYFGYGANMTREMMAWITGNENLKGHPAKIRGFKLGVQKLNQIPSEVSQTSSAPVSPQQILRENWGENFESYVMFRADPDSEVAGTIWELTNYERELVRNWELIDFGWYEDLRGVRTNIQEGEEVVIETEVLRENQEIDRQVDGLKYEPFLMPQSEFKRIAERERGEYLERQRIIEKKIKFK
ncbi:MAG: hypothetical protein A3H51_01675 [Candidatus Spechtbacteria bacterium RIFCSPLOWO2_02_FULL_38_8]|uniref:Gamma-glutamylcyclotransferase AIG2-like domain-containing protein n=1 Tax=Candidatus Spechtbacteria bacterium RIFCSPLOWO2_02_FULL_38_8 TaxID=1802164 RepID=A0A1G2HJN2_9BACT|nr:MAG: hypothetical protein A3H51_01675 [Candidatus Spechtbacteria bacterium RIFCSPLOWO2_02_FULL_38_8]